MDRSILRKNLRPFASTIPLILTIGLLYWLMAKFGFEKIISGFAQLNTINLIGASVFFAISRILQAARFYFLLPAGQSFWKHVGLNFCNQSGNSILGLRIGDAIRPFYLKRWQPKIPMKTILGWTFFELIIEAVAFIPFMAGAIWILSHSASSKILSSWSQHISDAMYFIYFASIIAIFSLFSRKIKRIVKTLVTNSRYIWGFGIGFFAWAAWIAMFWCLFPDWQTALVLGVFSMLAKLIPALPAGMGTFEAAFVWSAQSMGISADISFPAALVLHFCQIIVVLVIGIPCLQRWGWPSNKALQKLKQQSTDNDLTDNQF